MIISRTPFRMSFFGGGTDYPDWYKQFGGSVLSASFDKYCYITCRRLPPFFEHKYRIAYSKVETVNHISEILHPAVREILHHFEFHDLGMEIHYDADLPARSGLGSSSAFTVGLVHALKAFRGEYISNEELAKKAIYVEQTLLKETVGSQDQIATACGGFNRIDFHPSGTFKLTPVIAKPQKINLLKDHLMLFFTGFSRYASEIAQSKVANFTTKADSLHTMQHMVNEAMSILQNDRDIEQFGKLLDENWRLKRSLSDKISTSHIDDIYESAKRAGATGGKILGAGGGGFILFFVKPELQQRVKNALAKLLYITFDFEYEGSKIVLYQPNGL